MEHDWEDSQEEWEDSQDEWEDSQEELEYSQEEWEDSQDEWEDSQESQEEGEESQEEWEDAQEEWETDSQTGDEEMEAEGYFDGFELFDSDDDDEYNDRDPPVYRRRIKPLEEYTDKEFIRRYRVPKEAVIVLAQKMLDLNILGSLHGTGNSLDAVLTVSSLFSSCISKPETFVII